MLKQILIVDDDILIRNRIRYLLHYPEYGFEICGDVANGEEAIAFLNKHKVDIVISDVLMPGKTGIELAEYVAANFPEIIVIIMSNYTDFQYVKLSFKLGAVDYLLKYSITPQSLLELLQEKIKKTSQSSPAPSLHGSSATIPEFIKHCIVNCTEDFLDGGAGQIAVMRLQSYSLLMAVYDRNELNILMENIVNMSLQGIKSAPHSAGIYLENGVFVFLFPISKDGSGKSLLEYMDLIRSLILKFFNYDTTWGTTELTTADAAVYDCYVKALECLYKNEESHSTATQKTFMISYSQEQSIINAIKHMDKEDFISLVDSIFDSAENGNTNFIPIVNKLISIIIQLCLDFDIDLSACDLSRQLKDFKLLQNSVVSKGMIQNLFKQIGCCMIDIILENSSVNQVNRYVQEAVSYMSRHYAEPIHLKDIAAAINISEPYLSRIFKKETGESLSSYLLNIRIEKAKDLICEGNLSLKQIFFLVGFNNYNYFFTSFKKITGYTPKEYARNINLKKKND